MRERSGRRIGWGIATLLWASCAAHTGGGIDGADASTGGDDAGVVDLSVSATDPLRGVLLVGNSVSGTVSFLDGTTWQNLGSVDVVPDLQARLDEIHQNPITAIAYDVLKQKQQLRHFEPQNGDRFVDDVFVSPDGSMLYVSRSNLGDVAAFDLRQIGQPLVWRTHVDGFKADHATLSPDGKRLVVSATSVDKVDVLDASTGAIIGSFATGHFPHQNDYSANGQHIYNGSIGDVSLPYAKEADKGLRQLTVVDATTLEVVRTYRLARGLRPAVISSDEKTMYAQLSYLNGLVEYDLVGGTIMRTLDTPKSAFAQSTYPTEDDYPHDSAHHGLAISGDGSRLCDCGTIDDTITIVSTASMSIEHTLDTGLVPYWATTSGDGQRCFVSLSGANAVAVIDYTTGLELTRTTVGRFPQRSRLGRVHDSALARLAPGG